MDQNSFIIRDLTSFAAAVPPGENSDFYRGYLAACEFYFGIPGNMAPHTYMVDAREIAEKYLDALKSPGQLLYELSGSNDEWSWRSLVTVQQDDWEERARKFMERVRA